jgi:hypothetical protein
VGLAVDDDGGGFERCAICGTQAVGPCARCGRAVCGDCCVLTEGGAKTYAICTTCDRRGGKSLTGAWLRVAAWVLWPVLVLAAALLLLHFL